MVITSRLELCPFTTALAQAIADGDAGDRLCAAGYPRDDDRDAARMFLHAPSAEFGSYEIRIRATGEAVGTIGFFGPPDPDGTVMIGYGLVEQARGHGYATEAVRELIAYAMSRPQVVRVVADTERDNLASRRVLEKCGFGHTADLDGTLRYTLIR